MSNDAIDSIINILASGSTPLTKATASIEPDSPHDAHLDIKRFSYDEKNRVLYCRDRLIPNHPKHMKISDCLTIKVSNPQTGGYRVFGGRHINNAFDTVTYICLSDATLELEIHL